MGEEEWALETEEARELALDLSWLVGETERVVSFDREAVLSLGGFRSKTF